MNQINAEKINENKFVELVIQKNPNVNKELLKKAFVFSKKYHGDKLRKSGEPYFVHPIEVCLILLENNISETAVICAGLLHDLIEDTEVSFEVIEKEFEKEIAMIVESLTKLSKHKFTEKGEYDFYSYNSENLRKIILATAKDVRVMFIKLADRLHNMRTLKIFREEKQQRIAKQTLKVYAPIAEKLGLYKIKSELEDLCLLYLKPEIFNYLAKKIELTKSEREEKTEEIKKKIIQLLEENKINHKISGRAKHFYSIYNKMIEENKDLTEIYDIYGIRIIVETKEECYHVQKLLEAIWQIEISKKTGKPLIKDFVKNPKPNGYQSIHVNIRYEDSIVEVQIRTKEMDDLAEMGVAKHWKYKSTERDKRLDRKIDWLRQLLAWKLNPLNKEAVENYKVDIFGGEIVCITPKGDPIILKEGSTPIDFAYAIHSKVGDHIEKVEVNGEQGILTQELQGGDIVNIITTPKKMVSKQWLSNVMTNEARTKIRQSLGMTKQTSPKKKNVPSKEEVIEFQLEKRISVVGKKAPIKISKCCNLKWGDQITGYYTKDKKVTVHRKDCPDRFALDQKSEVPVLWEDLKKNSITVSIVAEEKPGTLAEILTEFLEEEVNILKINSEEKRKNILLLLEIEEKHIDKVKKIIGRIDKKEEIISIHADF